MPDNGQAPGSRGKAGEAAQDLGMMAPHLTLPRQELLLCFLLGTTGGAVAAVLKEAEAEALGVQLKHVRQGTGVGPRPSLQVARRHAAEVAPQAQHLHGSGRRHWL